MYVYIGASALHQINTNQRLGIQPIALTMVNVSAWLIGWWNLATSALVMWLLFSYHTGLTVMFPPYLS